MCDCALLSPGVTAADTWHAFALRKFRKNKVRGKALKDKRHDKKVGKMCCIGRDSKSELDMPVPEHTEQFEGAPIFL